MKRRDEAALRLAAQRTWMAKRGSTLAGYLAFYRDDYGPKQIAAIHAADREMLDDLMGQAENLPMRRRSRIV